MNAARYVCRPDDSNPVFVGMASGVDFYAPSVPDVPAYRQAGVKKGML